MRRSHCEMVVAEYKRCTTFVTLWVHPLGTNRLLWTGTSRVWSDQCFIWCSPRYFSWYGPLLFLIYLMISLSLFLMLPQLGYLQTTVLFLGKSQILMTIFYFTERLRKPNEMGKWLVYEITPREMTTHQN